MTMAAISQRTSRVRLGQMVGCNSYRNPAVLAKMTSTVDVMSGGRLDWGIGAGWYEHEYKAYGYEFPAAKDRIGMLRECVEIVRTMWTENDATFDGKYYKVAGAQCDPKPVQQPHPPIWVGGETGPSMRRAARIGDVWYPIGSNKANMLDTLPRLQAGIARLRELARQAGRDPAKIGVAYRIKRHSQPAPLASDGHRKLFTGSIANVIEDIAALRELGVTAMDFDFEGRDTDRAIEEMKKFRDEVLARI
jgi:probable F420-dependent oxidoreductase